MERLVLNRWFCDMVNYKKLIRTLRYQFDCCRKLPGINKDVIGKPEFFQELDAPQKCRPQHETIIRLRLHDMAKSTQLWILRKKLKALGHIVGAQVHPTDNSVNHVVAACQLQQKIRLRF